VVCLHGKRSEIKYIANKLSGGIMGCNMNTNYEKTRIISLGGRSSLNVQSLMLKVYYRHKNIYFIINDWSSWQQPENKAGALFDEGEEFDSCAIEGILLLKNVNGE
jgi:hypothetical protein